MKRIVLLLPFLMSSALFAAEDVIFLISIEELIAQDSSIVHKRFAGLTALHLASARGALRIMQKLIDHGADVDAATPTGLTPLLFAVCQNQPEAAELLLANGANPNLANRHGLTPLHIAADSDDTHGVQLLLSYQAHTKQRSNIKMFTYGGQTPLQIAIMFKRDAIIPIFEQWRQDHEALISLSAALHHRVGQNSPARHLDQQSLSLIAGYVLNLKKPLLVDTIDKQTLWYRSLGELAGIGLECAIAALLASYA